MLLVQRMPRILLCAAEGAAAARLISASSARGLAAAAAVRHTGRRLAHAVAQDAKSAAPGRSSNVSAAKGADPYSEGLQEAKGLQLILPACCVSAGVGIIYSAWRYDDPTVARWDDRTRQRVNTVYSYVGATIFGAGTVASASLRFLGASRAISMPIFAFSFAGCIGSILMLQRGENNPAWWLSFTLFEGLSFAGIFAIYPAHVLKHAAMATASLCVSIADQSCRSFFDVFILLSSVHF